MSNDRDNNDWGRDRALVLDHLVRLQQGQDDLREAQVKDREDTAEHRKATALSLQNVNNRLDTEVRVLYAKATGFGIAIGMVVTYVLPWLERIMSS